MGHLGDHCWTYAANSKKYERRWDVKDPSQRQTKASATLIPCRPKATECRPVLDIVSIPGTAASFARKLPITSPLSFLSFNFPGSLTFRSLPLRVRSFLTPTARRHRAVVPLLVHLLLMLVLLLVPGLRLMLILLVMLILMVLLLLPMLLCVRRMLLLLLLHATAAAIRSGIPSVSATALVIHVLLELWAWTQPGGPVTVAS